MLFPGLLPPADGGTFGQRWLAAGVCITIALSGVAAKASGLAFWLVVLVALGVYVRAQGWKRLSPWMQAAILAPLLVELGNAWWFSAAFSTVNLFALLAILVVGYWARSAGSLLVWAMVAGSALGAVLACTMALGMKQWLQVDRAATPGMNELLFAVMALLLATTSLAGWAQSDRLELPRWLRQFCLVGGICGLVAAGLSGSRITVLASVVIGFMLLVQAGRRQDWPRSWKLGAPLAAAMALAGILLWTPVGERMKQTAHDLQRWQSSEALGSSTQERLRLAQAAWLVIQQSPWVGIGPGAFRPAVESLRQQGRVPQSMVIYRHPHLTYLTVLVESGVIGALGWIAALVALGLLFRRHAGPASTVGSWLLIQCLVLSLGTDLQAHQSSLRLIAILLGVCVAAALAQPSSSRSSPPIP